MTNEEKALLKSKDIKLNKDVFTPHQLLMQSEYLEQDI